MEKVIDTSRALPRSQFDYHRKMNVCPANMRGGMRRYLEHGIPPGGYLTAVLCNDLMDAMGRADLTSRATMFELTSYLYNDTPMNCRGSKERVKEWCESGGLIGRGLLKLTDGEPVDFGE